MSGVLERTSLSQCGLRDLLCLLETEVEIPDANINMNDARDGWDDLALEGPDFKCPHYSNEESDSDI